MGIYFADQFSLLHFAVGIVFYFFGMPLLIWIILHIIFELLENSSNGIKFINKWVKIWPGGKPKADSIINSIGDVVFGIFGWIVAYNLDNYGSKMGWYSSHIVLNKYY